MLKWKSIITSVCLLLLSFSLSQGAPGSLVPPAETIVTLRAGTVVSVELNEELNPQELSAGNAIDLMVRSNVLVNGKVVIATGAIAEGMVKKVKRGCGGDCIEVTVTVESVQTVDGQRIFLRSIPHVMKANCCRKKDQEPVLNIGTKVSSRVLNDAHINV